MRTTLIALSVLLSMSLACTSTGDRESNYLASYPMTATDLDGAVFDIGAELDEGKIVALVFWRTGCRTCQEEAPALAQAARTHGDAIRFLGVVPGPERVASAEELRRTAGEWGIPYPTLRDSDLALSNLLGVAGTPTIIVIDGDRNIRYRSTQPPRDWSQLARR